VIHNTDVLPGEHPGGASFFEKELIPMNGPTLAEARSLENYIDGIAHLAREGGWGRRAGGLRPETALESIAVLAASSLTEAAALRGRALAANVESLPAEGVDLEAHLEAVRKKLMQEALDRCAGVQTRAAEILRMSFRSFRYYRRKYSPLRETDEKGSGIEPATEKDVEHQAALKAAAEDELKRAGLL